MRLRKPQLQCACASQDALQFLRVQNHASRSDATATEDIGRRVATVHAIFALVGESTGLASKSAMKVANMMLY